MVETNIDELLALARASLTRLTPVDACEAMAAGAILIDIRGDGQRASDGHLPGAKFIPRNVLEWRLDPSSSYRDEQYARRDRLLVLICNQGYQSSLAAATLLQLGLNVTDVIGGFQAWVASDLPVRNPMAASRMDHRAINTGYAVPGLAVSQRPSRARRL